MRPRIRTCIAIKTAARTISFVPPFIGSRDSLLCGDCLLKAIASADRRNLQVQVSMLWMTALIEYLQVCSMTGHNAYQYIRLVMLAEVSAKTALTVLNRLHFAVLRFLWM
jgi:hypothetical protein